MIKVTALTGYGKSNEAGPPTPIASAITIYGNIAAVQDLSMTPGAAQSKVFLASGVQLEVLETADVVDSMVTAASFYLPAVGNESPQVAPEPEGLTAAPDPADAP